MFQTAAPTDQRAGVRPIAFVLNDAGQFSAPVTLKIRPADLQRNEPSRIAVHQTLGRDIHGWVDNFGQGLPSCTISGNTGWRASGMSGKDGAQHFEELNDLVMHRYHSAKQAAVESGRDPASVRLLFVDMLDDFCWNVAPMAFQLRRSKSSPLLFQYHIQLQAITTDVDNPLRILPFLGDLTTGIDALDRVLDTIWDFAGKVEGWVSKALSFVDKLLAPIAKVIDTFVKVSASVLGAVQKAVGAIKNGITGVANRLIGLAGGIAQVGINIFRTIASIASLPAHLRWEISRVGSAYNEAACILGNSLRARGVYSDFDDLYGASNCSSTTGGRSPSRFSHSNVFELMQPGRSPIEISSAAIGSISTLGRFDPVLAPIPLQEIGRHVDIINSGVLVL